MLMVRLLLPFTHGIDSAAITSALALAQRLNATLMLLSLVQQPREAGKSPRWEAIQQSQDFLEFTAHRAARAGIAVERVELYTGHASRAIRAFAQEMECAGIVLAVRRGKGILLATHEVKHLIEEKRIPVYIVALPTRNILSSAFPWLSRWLGHKNAESTASNSILRRQIFSHQAKPQSHDSPVLTDS